MPALTIPSRVHDPTYCCVPVIPTCALVTINVCMLTCSLFVAATFLALRHRPATAFGARYQCIAKLSHPCPCSCIDHLCKCSPPPPRPFDTLQTISPSSPSLSALLSNGPGPRSGSRVDLCIILHHHCNMRFRACGRRQQSMAGPRVYERRPSVSVGRLAFANEAAEMDTKRGYACSCGHSCQSNSKRRSLSNGPCSHQSNSQPRPCTRLTRLMSGDWPQGSCGREHYGRKHACSPY